MKNSRSNKIDNPNRQLYNENRINQTLPTAKEDKACKKPNRESFL